MKKRCTLLAALLFALPAFAQTTALSDETFDIQKSKSYYVGGALNFAGTTGYSFNPPSGPLLIQFDELQNDSSVATSGLVRVAIIVSVEPVVPGVPLTFWTAGWIDLQPIPPGYHYTNISELTTLRTPPPDGLYYVTMVALEQEAGCTTTGTLAGYCFDDWGTFPTRRWVVGGVWQPIGYQPPAITTTTAVEYYNASFNHYFVTADPAEISGLDGGAYNYAFLRTGQQWKVYTSGNGADILSVCRFFTTPGTFGTKSSHFYTADPAECAGLKFNPAWIYEKIAGGVKAPTNGVCPAGTQPLYRVYNNGLSGAPNHRYTTSLAIRAQMIGQGGVAEDINTACVPL